MILPLLSQNSRQLLQRFFAREGRLAVKAAPAAPAASSSQSSSSEASTSQSSSQSTLKKSHNPFASALVKNAHGHNKYRSAKYSPRRQKQLYKAMEIVKLQEELFKPSSSIEGIRTEETVSGQSSQESTFAIPKHWVLPESTKSRSAPSLSNSPLSGQGEAPQATESSTSKIGYTAADATKRGPYKGRRNGAFKHHKWERNKESLLAERREKLASMPERIAEYTKVRCSSSFT